MNHDHTAAVGFTGTVATLTLGDAHLLAGLCVAFVTVGYVGSKWFFLIRDRRRARK
jgi:hypothetical protein